MIKATLYLLCQSGFQHTSWGAGMVKSIADEATRQEIFLKYTNEIHDLPKEEMPVVLGSDKEYLAYPGRLLFAGENPLKNPGEFSLVSLDRRRAMKEMIHHLYERGARRIALLGTDIVHHQSDHIRFLGWRDAVQELEIGDGIHGVFHRNDQSENFYQEFLLHVHEYDAVACTNDNTALKLIKILQSHQISVPGDLLVAGFGNLYLSQWSDPTLSSINIHLEEVPFLFFRQAASGSHLQYLPCSIQKGIDRSAPYLYSPLCGRRKSEYLQVMLPLGLSAIGATVFRLLFCFRLFDFYIFVLL